MDPGTIPIELSHLTDLEKILVARIHPVTSIYHAKDQQYKHNGNMINFVQDVNLIARVLPYNPTDLSAILIVNTSGSHAHEYENKESRVRREFVRQALDWLKHINAYYNNIIIDSGPLQKLPADEIPADLSNTSQDEVKYQDEEKTYLVCKKRA